MHTGDFKVDYTPVFGDAIDLQRFAEIGKKGVLALLSDSTNAERKGFTQSERTVGITFDHIFAEHQNTRIIIATFASNVDRVQQIINSACKYDRKVVVEGRSMVNIIQVAQELGYLNVPENTMIEIDQLKNYPPEKTVLITTGSQGESMAAPFQNGGRRSQERRSCQYPGDTVISASIRFLKMRNLYPELSMSCRERCKCYLSGCSCIRSCVSGRIKVDLFTGQTKVCSTGTW